MQIPSGLAPAKCVFGILDGTSDRRTTNLLRAHNPSVGLDLMGGHTLVQATRGSRPEECLRYLSAASTCWMGAWSPAALLMYW